MTGSGEVIDRFRSMDGIDLALIDMSGTGKGIAYEVKSNTSIVERQLYYLDGGVLTHMPDVPASFRYYGSETLLFMPRAISDSGTVIGQIRCAWLCSEQWAPVAAKYTNGVYSLLNVRNDGAETIATSINNRDDITVVRHLYPADYAGQGEESWLQRSDGSRSALRLDGFVWFAADSVNDAGIAIGQATTVEISPEGGLGYRWGGVSVSPSGTIYYGDNSEIRSINNHGQMILYSPGRTLLADDQGSVDLSSIPAVTALGWDWVHFDEVGDNGQILGQGGQGETHHYFLLRPVPEPSTVMLWAMAFVGLVFVRRRERNLLKAS